jgi:hypothetical protein
LLAAQSLIEALPSVSHPLAGGAVQSREAEHPKSTIPRQVLPVAEAADCIRKPVFTALRTPPPSKRAREMGQPLPQLHTMRPTHQHDGVDQHNEPDASYRDLFSECCCFVQHLGKLPEILPCCGYELDDIQAVRPRCPVVSCEEFDKVVARLCNY